MPRMKPKSPTRLTRNAFRLAKMAVGFWYKKPTAIFANLKAFLVNRVGDFGFILGIGLIATYAHTLDYAQAFDAFTKSDTLRAMTLPDSDWLLVTVVCVC